MPTRIAVRCLHCHSDQVVTQGKTVRGAPRYLCQDVECATDSFRLDSRHRGCVPEVKHRIIDMRLHVSGVRDTARTPHISPDTMLSALTKKAPVLESGNTALLRTLHPDEVTVNIGRAGEAERDKMWSCVGKKGHQCWGGTPAIITPERSWPLALAVAKMRGFSRAKHGSSPSV